MLQILNESDKYDDNHDRTYSSYTLEVIDCARYKCDSFKFKKRINSENYTLLTVVKGTLFFKNGESATHGGLVFLPKFSNTEIKTDKNSEFIQIAFRLSGFKTPLPKAPKTLIIESDIYNSIEHLYRTANFYTAIEGVKEAILLDILNRLTQYFYAASNEVSIYQKICSWIEANAERDISVEDVAEALGYSREHLNRIVKSIDNERLSDKIVKYRMENIKVLCEAENLSIAEIAKKLGFYSRELLCKYFKYHMGISINDYRKRL